MFGLFEALLVAQAPARRSCQAAAPVPRIRLVPRSIRGVAAQARPRAWRILPLICIHSMGPSSAESSGNGILKTPRSIMSLIDRILHSRPINKKAAQANLGGSAALGGEVMTCP